MDHPTRQKRAANTPPPPLIPESLIAYLNTVFPDRCARPGETQEDIWMAAGARKVVNHLKGVQEGTDPLHVNTLRDR